MYNTRVEKTYQIFSELNFTEQKKFSFDNRPMFQQSQESNPSYTMGLGTNKYPGTKFSFDHRPMFQQSLDSNPSYTMGLMIKQYPDRNIPSFFSNKTRSQIQQPTERKPFYYMNLMTENQHQSLNPKGNPKT